MGNKVLFWIHAAVKGLLKIISLETVVCKVSPTNRTWRDAVCLVEVELELEGRAVLEVVEGVVEGSSAARGLRVQRVGACVERGALLRVRQDLRAERDNVVHSAVYL